MSSYRLLPVFTIALQGVNVAERGAKDHDDADQTGETDESEREVRSGEQRPGFHLVVLTEVSIARCLRIVKGGKPPKEVG